MNCFNLIVYYVWGSDYVVFGIGLYNCLLIEYFDSFVIDDVVVLDEFVLFMIGIRVECNVIE